MVTHIESGGVCNQCFSAKMRWIYEFLCKVLVGAVQDAELCVHGCARVWSREPTLLPHGLYCYLRATGVAVLCRKLFSVELHKLVSVVKPLWWADTDCFYIASVKPLPCLHFACPHLLFCLLCLSASDCPQLLQEVTEPHIQPL